jgi:plasmid stabilization system protein ParE
LAQVVWSEQALDQLSDVFRFIARGSPRLAQIFVERVSRVVDRLEHFPLSGRVIPEVGDPLLREVIAHGYRVMYRVREDRVEILLVHHGARRFPEPDQFEA